VKFRAEGRIEWAILAATSAKRLEALVTELEANPFALDDDDKDPQSWTIVPGKKKYAAMIETAPGSTGTERDLAAALSKKLRSTVYTVGFAGYDDPDHGLPYIERYDDGKTALIWMAPSDDDDGLGEPKTVAGPEGVPCDDPFDFAEALGCSLRTYFRYPSQH